MMVENLVLEAQLRQNYKQIQNDAQKKAELPSQN
jgi:hypothetical protein